MKAINHRIFNASFLLIIGGSWAEIAYSFLLGSIPDQIERIGSRRIMKHRGFSHDIGLWATLIFFVLLFPFSHHELISIPYGKLNEILHFRTWVLFLPGFLHCFADLLTPKGVPFMGIRVSLPLFKNGLWKEYVFSWSFLIAGILIHAEKFGKVMLALWNRIGFP